MANNAPGKHYREGMSLVEVMRKFPRRRNGGTVVH